MLLRITFAAWLFICSLPAIVAGQDGDRAQQPQPTQTTQPAQAPTPQKEQPQKEQPQKQAEAPRPLRFAEANVHIEVTITDQSGTAAPDKKVVSLLAADRTMGRIRANATREKPTLGRMGSNLNVDARPTILEGNRIMLELTLEYTPLRENDVLPPTNLNESLNVLLINGKPQAISQAADPVSDRRMTVEVKATVVK